MAVEVDIIPATPDHARALAPMRRADWREIRLAGEPDPQAALLRAVVRSDRAWAGRADGRVACLFGVARAGLIGGGGIPWLIGNELVERHAHRFLRETRAHQGLIRAGFDYLANHVHAENHQAVAWLKWLGYDIRPARPHGPFGAPFHLFAWRRPDV